MCPATCAVGRIIRVNLKSAPPQPMSLRHDTLWNIAGMGLPLLAAAMCIPFTLDQLGGEAFGVLTLIWALIGYFGLFDMGMGRALTFQVGKLLADKQEERIHEILNAGLLVTLLAGLAGCIVLLLAAGYLATQWLRISPPLQADACLAFQIAALGVIPTTVSSGLRGALDGFQRFAASNLTRLFYGMCMFIMPAVSISLHGISMSWIAAYLVGSRIVVVIMGVVQLAGHLRLSFSRRELRQAQSLLSYGFWVTVSGIVGPMMIYGDRFLIGAVVGADQLPFYAIPQEGLQRLLIIPGALCAALLPRFSAAQGPHLVSLVKQSRKQVALAMLAVCALAAVIGPPILSWWLSPDFAEKATPVILVLAIAIWFNALAQVPYTLVHALGKPRLTAYFHIFEMIFYFAILYWLASKYGLVGASVAWLIRVVIDLILLQVAATRLLRQGEVL